MNKSASSRFVGLAAAVVLVAVILLAGVYIVINSRNDSEQQVGNAENASQIDADKPLGTAANSIADDINGELNALADDDYTDDSLSDTALYE